MRGFRLIAPCLLITASAQAGVWSDLWYRPDQQAQRALRAGDPTRAAQLFTDPRAQAYAELAAEQNASAAKRLAPFTDGLSQYNRGNALAKSGDLPGALTAYDGALKHTDLESSLRRDAQHNRDLVARQLKNQKEQQHPSSAQPPPTPQGNKGDKSQAPEKDPKKGHESSQDGGSKDVKGSSSGESSTPATAGTPKPAPGKEDQPSTSKPGDSNATSNSTPSSAASPAGDSGEHPHWESNLAQPGAPGQKDSPSASGAQSDAKSLSSRTPTTGDLTVPQTEQQIAMEQWLRQIPEDPGGLLRRKFLIEHLMKQRQVQP